MHAPSNFHANTATIIPLFRAPTPGYLSDIVAKVRSNRTEAEARAKREKFLRDLEEAGFRGIR